MSYHIYTGKGIVLRERPLKESDLSLKILTRDLGLITALAIGLRKGNSKRRPPLTELSIADISLVRGKKDWRVTSANLEFNIYRDLKHQKNSLLPITRALALLERLVQGEEKHPELFEIVREFVDFAKNNDLSPDEAKIFESILIGRILATLGYLSTKEFPSEIFFEHISKSLLHDNMNANKELVQAINRGLKESGLI